MKNQIAKIIGELQAIRNLLRNGNLSSAAAKGLNKEIEMRKEMLEGIGRFS